MKGWLHIPQSSRTGVSPLDAVECHTQVIILQSVYIKLSRKGESMKIINDTVGISIHEEVKDSNQHFIVISIISIIWSGWVCFLWYINHHRLFNAKSCLFIHIKYV